MRSLSASAALLAALAAPTAASAHATVEPLGPARPHAGASARFVLDAPNEELTTPGTKVVLFVPSGAQLRVRAQRTPGWTLTSRRRAGPKAPHHDAPDLDRAAGPRRRARPDATLPLSPQGSVTPGAALLQDRSVLLAFRSWRAAEGRSLARLGG